MATPTNTEQDLKVASLSDWKKNKFHTVTLPSATVVEIAVPDLPTLVKTGAIPNELVDVAIGVASGRKVTRDDIVQQADFYNKLCALTIHKPSATEEDFANDLLPFEDKEMIVEIATRQRDLDAVGEHLAGLEKLASFRKFRGIDAELEGLAD
jgi:hypothetical protein